MAKKSDGQDRLIIARLRGDSEHENGAVACTFFLIIGAVVMFFAFILEGSAVRLTAWGAIWTEWNVLWGIGALANRHINYIVYRENNPPSD